MNYILLIIILFSLLLFFYILFKKDIFSPSFLLTISYFLSTVFAYISYKFRLWNNVSDISFYVILCISLGVLFFGIGELIVRIYFNKKNICSNKELKKYHMNKKVYIFTLIFIIITGVLIYLNLAKITHEYHNIPKMIDIYRKGSYFGEFEEKFKLNFIVMQLYRFIDIIGFILIYIVLKNLLLKDTIKENFKYILLILLICIISLFISGRTVMVRYLIAFILGLNMLNYKIYGSNINIKKLFKIIFICMLLGVPIFFLLLYVLGRNHNYGIINYITFYLGNPIASLQNLLNNTSIHKGTLISSSTFGSNTFVGLQTIVGKIGIHLFNESSNHILIVFDHKMYSNVFTGLYQYIIDFGIIGVIVCQTIYGIVLSIIYYFARYKDKIIYMILYFMISIYYVDSFRSEKLFTSMISLNMIIYVFYTIIILKLLFNKLDGGE